jgi:hypothetical protein
VTAKNTSTDNTLYQDSSVNVQTYTIAITKLPTPIITPTGGAFVSTSFPSTATISANSAPGAALSVLQYRITPSGGSARAWTTYSTPVTLAFGDKVDARNFTLNTGVYTTSNTTSQTYSLSLSTLPTPVNTPNGGTFTGDTFPGSVSVSSNGAPGGANSKLQYRKTTGGVVGAWTDYTTAITITYNDKIESKNVALNTTSYADSSVDTDTYTLAFSTLPKPINTPMAVVLRKVSSLQASPSVPTALPVALTAFFNIARRLLRVSWELGRLTARRFRLPTMRRSSPATLR